MKDLNIFDLYFPMFEPIGYEPIYMGELYGLDHEAAKKQYERLKAEGFYDDYDEDY